MREENSQKGTISELTAKGQRDNKNGLSIEKEPDKFDIAEDKLFDYLIDKNSLLDDPSKNQLIPASQRRAKLKKEFHEAAELLNLNIDLSLAFQILRDEGASYLDQAVYKEMADQLAMIPTYLDQLDFSQPLKENLCSSLHISDSTLQSIYQVGVAKYDESNLKASISIFNLLSTLDPENTEWIFRVGIIASQMEKWDQALKAFNYTLYLDPNHLQARIYSAVCYQKLNRINEAKDEIKEAKRLLEIGSPDPIWKEVLTSIEESINNKM